LDLRLFLVLLRHLFLEALHLVLKRVCLFLRLQKEALKQKTRVLEECLHLQNVAEFYRWGMR
jgi:hypothetical protein